LTESDWRALMVAAQSGNAEIYRRLLTQVSAWLHRYYVRRLPAPMVDDAVQEVRSMKNATPMIRRRNSAHGWPRSPATNGSIGYGR
jgi:DNA-directed RNA polymerase specialized sigma24 family protein